jgi:probable HAF family extracellular repeat protein
MIWRNAFKFAAASALSGATKKSGISMMLAALWLCAPGSLRGQTFTTVLIFSASNGSGQIAGWNSYNPDPNFDPQTFLYSNGSLLNINSATLFPSGTEAYGINNSGEVVGTGYVNASNFHAFLYSGGKMEDLGPSGAYQASAYAINTSGHIVATYSLNSGASGTFLYTGGTMSMLPNPAGSRGGFGVAINDNGEIVGALYPPPRKGATQLC